jgi:hypothetical protein
LRIGENQIIFYMGLAPNRLQNYGFAGRKKGNQNGSGFTGLKDWQDLGSGFTGLKDWQD